MDKKTERLVKKIFEQPDVQIVGFDKKITKGVITDTDAIIIGVEKKLPIGEIPAGLLIPKAVNGVATDVIQTGIIRVIPPIYPMEYVSRDRPIVPGGSIGLFSITAGTFGAVLYKKINGVIKAFIGSNNHVLADSSTDKKSNAKIGDPILQPGPYDGGTVSRDTVAKLSYWVPLKTDDWNLVDVALAEITTDYTDVIKDIGVPLPPIKSVTVGQTVQKTGRTTEHTTGTVQISSGSVKVWYDQDLLTFSDQIITTYMCDGGDSGSLVLDMQGRPVGLLFAGSDEVSIHAKAQNVMDALPPGFTFWKEDLIEDSDPIPEPEEPEEDDDGCPETPNEEDCNGCIYWGEKGCWFETCPETPNETDCHFCDGWKDGGCIYDDEDDEEPPQPPEEDTRNWLQRLIDYIIDWFLRRWCGFFMKAEDYLDSPSTTTTSSR